MGNVLLGKVSHILHIILLVYVITWVAVKFGINTMSVILEMEQISRGIAE